MKKLRKNTLKMNVMFLDGYDKEYLVFLWSIDRTQIDTVFDIRKS